MTHPIPGQLLEAADKIRQAGARVKLLRRFDRDAPHLLVGKAGRTSLIVVDLDDAEEGRSAEPVGSERWRTWWNGTHSVLAAKFCSTTDEAIEFANSSTTEPPDEEPPPPPPPPQTDEFENAFRWHYTGQFDGFARQDVSRIVAAEYDNVTNQRAPTLLWHHIVLNTDSPRRCEALASGEGRNFQEGDETTLHTEILFPSDFPSVSVNHYIGVFRFSANVNGLPPIELLVKKRTDGSEHVYLRHLGGDHDAALETTLDTAGGYIWSTPLVRQTSASAPNYLKLTFKIYWSTIASGAGAGWIELYQNHNLTTPVMARFTGKTMTDTSGTKRCYVRQGINAHPSSPSNIRVAYANTNWLTVRPIP